MWFDTPQRNSCPRVRVNLASLILVGLRIGRFPPIDTLNSVSPRQYPFVSVREELHMIQRLPS